MRKVFIRQKMLYDADDNSIIQCPISSSSFGCTTQCALYRKNNIGKFTSCRYTVTGHIVPDPQEPEDDGKLQFGTKLEHGDITNRQTTRATPTSPYLQSRF